MGKRDLIFVTSYPEKNRIHSDKTVGVASYTKLLVQELSKNLQDYIYIMAERMGKSENYTEGEVKVERTWRRGDAWSILATFWGLLFRRCKRIVVSFEINMFGGYLHAFVAMIGMGFLKLFGKKIILILHQAPEDLEGVEQNRIKLVAGNYLLKIFYKLLRLVTSKIVLFEEYLREVVGGKNTVFIPHFVLSIEENMSRGSARDTLGWDRNKKYALVFGYTAPYKGILELLVAWQNDFGYELVVAGGINPNHVHNSEMKEYLHKVEHLAREKGIVVTGFVDEKLIPTYYLACDLVVLPYKKMISSSGPLALAWKYKKPVLMSMALSKYTRSNDIKEAMAESGLQIEDVFFDNGYRDFSRVIGRITIPSMYKRFKRWSGIMRDKRNIASIAKNYANILDQMREDND